MIDKIPPKIAYRSFDHVYCPARGRKPESIDVGRGTAIIDYATGRTLRIILGPAGRRCNLKPDPSTVPIEIKESKWTKN